MGIFEAAALAAAQSREAQGFRLRFRALRYGRRDSLRHHRPGESQAQHLRHGPQVALEFETRWASTRGLSDQGRPAARGSARKAGWRICDLRPNGWPPDAVLGGKAR